MLLTEGESDCRSYFLGYVHLLSICAEVSGMITVLKLIHFLKQLLSNLREREIMA